MHLISFANAWRTSIDGHLERKKNQWGLTAGYPGVMELIDKKGGRFADWHLLYTPDGSEDLVSTIDIACVYPTHPYVATFLSWANEAADRALVDERFNIDPEAERLKGTPNWGKLRGWRGEIEYPGNHGKVLAAGCFARALRDDSELDEAALLLAIDEIVESALAGGAKFWDELSQGDYLRAVRLALVIGRVDKAQLLLKNIRRKSKWSVVHQEWLQTLCNAIENSSGAALAGAALESFQTFFDQVRDPQAQLPRNQKDGSNVHANISLLRLELAIIKQRYVLLKPLAGHWNHVLGLISE